MLRALLVSVAAFLAIAAQAADGIAFITNLKGEVSVDGRRDPCS